MEALVKRRSIGITGVLLLLMSLTVAVGLPAAADTTNPAVWDGNGAENLPCTGSLLWIFTGPNAPTLVLDGVSYPGTQQGEGAWHYLTPGANVTVNSSASVVWSGNQGNYVLTISHCDDGTTSTTTTQPPSSTTSTTQPPSSTTSTTQPPSSTTSTTQPPSSTTQATTAVSVAGIQVSAPVPAQVVTQETLPFTGLSTPGMAALAAALAAAGALLLTASRQTEEKAPARSWN